MGFFKNIRIGEKANLQFRTEMFNTWNHTNFDGVATTVTPVASGGFGPVPVVSARSPRILEFALKLAF